MRGRLDTTGDLDGRPWLRRAVLVILCVASIAVCLGLLSRREARVGAIADLAVGVDETRYAADRAELSLLLLEHEHALVRDLYGVAVRESYRNGLDARLAVVRDRVRLHTVRLEMADDPVRVDVNAIADRVAGVEAFPREPFDPAYTFAEERLEALKSCKPWEGSGRTREMLHGICELTADAQDTGRLVHHYLHVTDGAGIDDGRTASDLVAGVLGTGAIENRIGDNQTFTLARESDLAYTLEGLDAEVTNDNVTRLASTDTSALTAAGRFVRQRSRDDERALPVSFDQVSAAYLGHLEDLGDVRIATISEIRREVKQELEAAQGQSKTDLITAVAFPLTVIPLTAVFEFRRRRRSRRFVRRFMTDDLTGLPNRYFLEKFMPNVLSGRNRTNCAFMQVDIHRLKAVNETYGHAAGDQILMQVGAICTEAAGTSGQVIRLPGDEFVVALHSSPDPLADANRIAERIQKALIEPLQIRDLRIQVKVSIGIAVSRRPTTVDGLLLEAGSALLEAKATGRGQIVEYGNTNRGFIVRRLPIAFEQREIRCELQPQIDLRTGEIPAVEVLARWYPADGPRIAIPELIRTIESLGGTERLLRAMSAEAAVAARELGDDFTGRFFLNVSPLDLLPFDAADRILEVLLSGGLPPDRIGIEITETEQIGDLDHAANVLSELRQHNIAIAIDDFGVGNTPLIHLTDLPVDEVKLDRSVVSGIDGDRRNRSVVSAMTQVADTLSLSVVAEGIESASELDELRKLGVQFGQGYLFARPMPVGDLVDFLADWNNGGSAEILG